MALYYFCVRPISRQKGHSIVGLASYNSGQKLYDERTNTVHDFTHKDGVFHTEIMLPDNAPPTFADRQTLWNAVERTEKRRDSRTGREIVVALPRELTFETSIKLVRDFISDCFVALERKGLDAQVSHESYKQLGIDREPPKHLGPVVMAITTNA